MVRRKQTCAKEGYRFHLWENGCCGACSGLGERDDVHRGAYPEDTGDELPSPEAHVSTGTRSTTAAKDRGQDKGNTYLELVEMPLGLRAAALRFFSLVACWT